MITKSAILIALSFLVGCTQAAPTVSTAPADALTDAEFDGFKTFQPSEPGPAPQPAPAQKSEPTVRGVIENGARYVLDNYDINARLGFVHKGSGGQVSVEPIPQPAESKPTSSPAVPGAAPTPGQRAVQTSSDDAPPVPIMA